MADSRSDEIERQFAELGLGTGEQRSRFRTWATAPNVVAGGNLEVRLYGVTNTSASPDQGWVHNA
jgi:hypothetical protein